MKKIAFLPLFALSFLALSATSRAEEVTITGVGACAKCVLSLTSKCQNAITVTDKDLVNILQELKALIGLTGK